MAFCAATDAPRSLSFDSTVGNGFKTLCIRRSVCWPLITVWVPESAGCKTQSNRSLYQGQVNTTVILLDYHVSPLVQVLLLRGSFQPRQNAIKYAVRDPPTKPHPPQGQQRGLPYPTHPQLPLNSTSQLVLWSSARDQTSLQKES